MAGVPTLDDLAPSLIQRVGARPDVAIVLGSGLGAFAERLTDSTEVPYSEVPGLPQGTVEGHAGNLVFGSLGDRQVAILQGRAHLYEGFSAAEVVFGVRVLVAMGASTLIVTNAAGAIRNDLEPGDLMLIEDHINLTGHNPLSGRQQAPGPRFTDMTAAYDAELMAVARQTSGDAAIKSGVYAGLLGPSYETPAEIRMLRTLGADAVGMSTVLEVIAARQMGARCLGVSCITNKAAGLGGGTLNHQDVQQRALATADRFAELLARTVGAIDG